ncbi:heme-binding domain-containing protein [Aequorivita todarodis]|uniref:heme-binding domain-containing protein n=1 Tax=Aequorivita todarodis TaxID=2036821 RepID=UPI002350FDDB|nr:heme-binding domain-containing protein [Aequorivita todarodis]MDC8000824.1 heme-binding domain-containing protein [Aequorivita todarodis]
MKKILKIIVLVLIVAFVAIQFIPTERNQSDMVPKTDFVVANNPPAEISALLKESCYDCHSNHTDYPWYNKIQPVAWFLEHHIKEAKAELNFSEWNDLSVRRKNSKLRSIINQIKDDEMPLWSYTLMHRHAVLSEAEKESIIAYITEVKDRLP